MVQSHSRNEFIPLCDAEWRFAPNHLKAEHHHLESQPAPGWSEAMTGDPVVDGPATVRAFFSTLQHMNRTAPANWKMQKHLRDGLSRGIFIARGMRTRPGMSDYSEPIDANYFLHAKIDWKLCIVENFGRRFEGVEVSRRPNQRITLPAELKTQPTQPRGTQSAQIKKRGRPSNDGKIMQAILYLESQGIDFGARHRKEAYNLIKDHIHQTTGIRATTGYSTAVLNKCINRHLVEKHKSL